jgi:heme/copper-type cytochrome/quinol oxidase subunit 3
MNCRATVSQLKSQSTWRLLFLSLVTLGIYTAHYIKRQTRIINQQLAKKHQISEDLVSVILILAYVTVILLVPYFLVEEGHPVERISNKLDLVWIILFPLVYIIR